ncbi:unnamed protein product [Didymodactylos carnosus]|nr:unnamed protein product [Didymodactylos carnosus]CAF4382199.1 unnamed protein product [Didymodactylos carnosus]
MLLQEYAPEGNLYEVLQHVILGENILREIFIQTADAMVFLAHNHIVHGDLACRNILVFRFDEHEPRKNLVKLTDFGISRHSKLYVPTNTVARTTINIVPIRYAAPEVLMNELYSEKSDAYSMGVLMWEAYSKGSIPWSKIESDDEVRQRITSGEKLRKPANCSARMWSIIDKCFILSVEQRPTFTNLKYSLLQAQYELAVCKPTGRIKAHPFQFLCRLRRISTETLDQTELQN